MLQRLIIVCPPSVSCAVAGRTPDDCDIVFHGILPLNRRLHKPCFWKVPPPKAEKEHVHTHMLSICRQSRRLCRQEGKRPAARTRLRGRLAHLRGEKCLLRGTRPRKRRIWFFSRLRARTLRGLFFASRLTLRKHTFSPSKKSMCTRTCSFFDPLIPLARPRGLCAVCRIFPAAASAA